MQKVRIPLLVLGALLASETAIAQGYYEFLGPGRSVPDQYTDRYLIRYNTGGFDDPWSNPDVDYDRVFNKLQKKGASDSVIETIKNFPGPSQVWGQNPIGEWIDAAFEATQTQFAA